MNNIIISKSGNEQLISANIHFNYDEASLDGVSNADLTLSGNDFSYYDSLSNKDVFEFGYYYGFQDNKLTSFRLDDSMNKTYTRDNYILPRNLSIDMSIDEYIEAYDINSTNSVIQVWKGLSFFYIFDKTSISSLTKDAEWADIVIGWYQTNDDEWHRLSAEQAANLMRNNLNIECKAVYSISIDCKNTSKRNSVIYVYSTLEDWEAFNK